MKRVNTRFLENILSKWHYIKEQFDGLEDFGNIDPQIVLSEWSEHKFKENKKYKIVCGDGSYNTIDYIDKYLILSAGLGVSSDKDGKLEFEYNSFLIVIPFNVIVKKFLDDLASLIMSTLELKSIYLISKRKKPDIVVLDGSIRNFIIRFGPSHSREIGQNWFLKGDLDERKVENLYDEYKDEIYNHDIWAYYVLKEQKDISREDKFVYFAHLLYYEYLKVLDDILREFKVISISKSFSASSEVKIFPFIVAPDILIFNNYTNSVGYSRIEHYIDLYDDEYKDYRKFKWKLPEPFRHLEKKDIKFFYVRFEERYRVYKVEFVGNLNQDFVLDVLSPAIVGGYFYLLKLAHNEVLIRDSDTEIIESYIKQEFGRDLGIKLRSELEL